MSIVFSFTDWKFNAMLMEAAAGQRITSIMTLRKAHVKKSLRVKEKLLYHERNNCIINIKLAK